jgi:hypothetical protein
MLNATDYNCLSLRTTKLISKFIFRAPVLLSFHIQQKIFPRQIHIFLSYNHTELIKWHLCLFLLKSCTSEQNCYRPMYEDTVLICLRI